MDFRPILIGALWFAMMLAPVAKAQNEPVSGLTPRGAVQSTDIMPILAQGAPRLQYTTITALATAIGGGGGGSGTVTTVTCGVGLTGGTFNIIGTCALAFPSATVIGGVESFAPQTHKFLTGISTLGVPQAAQPACTDLSDATYCNVSLTNGITLGNVAQIGANTWLGNQTGSLANVAANAWPICPDAGGQHLNYVSGSGVTCGTSSAQALAPNLLKFGPPTLLNTAGSAGYYDPQPAGLIDVTDGFTSAGNYSTTGSTATFTFTVSAGAGTISQSNTGVVIARLSSDATLLAPQFFNAIEVTAQTPATGYSNIYVGSFLDAGHYAGCYYDATGHAIHIEVNHSGIENSSVKSVTLAAPYVLGCGMVNNSLTAWYKTAPTGPWLYAGAFSPSGIDYTVTANFASAGYKTGFLTSMGAAGAFTVSTLQGGREGGVGMRDLKPVVNADWTTYQPGSNLIYFSASMFEPGGAGEQGVFTLNVSSQVITQTATICTQRTVSATSHTYCSDNAASIVAHANGEPAGGTTGDRTIVLSSWANGANNSTPVQVLYKYITHGGADLLTTNLTVLSSLTQLTLPEGSSGLGAYDPALVYDAPNARYLLAYSICNDCTFGSASTQFFYPALAYASSPTGSWTGIGQDTTVQGNWEGTSFANVNGTLYELAGGAARSLSPAIQQCASSRVYDMTFAFLGSILGATFDAAPGGTTEFSCSHPTLFQHPDGQHVVVLTFLGGSFTGASNILGQPVVEISTP